MSTTLAATSSKVSHYKSTFKIKYTQNANPKQFLLAVTGTVGMVPENFEKS